MNIRTQFIEAKMAEQGLTKKALSANCGISAQNISTAGKLAAGLGVPVADIIKEA